MATRQLYKVSQDGKRTLLATFELKGNTVSSTWKDDNSQYKMDIESNGIVAGRKVVTPDDGKAFFDALPLAFKLSSTMFVVDS